MKVAVAASPSRRHHPKDKLEEFACLMCTAFSSIDRSSNDAAAENPKTRLDLLLSTHDEWAVSFPSLSLPTTRASAPLPDSSAAEHHAEVGLGRRVQYDRKSVSAAPENMARSVAESFESLVYANLRSFAKMRDSEKRWDTSAAESFKNKIGSRTVVRVRRVASKFTSVPPEECCSEDTKSSRLPLQVDFSIGVDIGGDDESFLVTTRGQIKGCTTPKLSNVDVELDCRTLLFSLRQHARLAAYKFITRHVSASIMRTSAEARDAASHSMSKPRHIVTPCSSPLLSILSAAAATKVEPLGLDESSSSSERAAVAVERGTLPPKKRLRRAITPTPMDSAKQ